MNNSVSPFSDQIKNAQPIITCEEKTLYKLPGESATFKCFATFGSGNPTLAHLIISWKRVGILFITFLIAIRSQ